MPKKRLFTDVMEAIERRIAAGDYMLRDLPGERRLAEEVGVSYMTARKAVTGLIERGVLARRPNGSLIVNPGRRGTASAIKVALLTPAYPSLHLLQCRDAVSRVAEARRVQFRPVEYVHWDDPTVAEAVSGADGVIVIPSTEPIPSRVLRVFTDPDNRVVFLDDDMTDHGVPSVRLFAKAHITKVFDHLWNLGHRRIDCLNVQGRNREIVRRIGEWLGWLERRQAVGSLIDAPVEPYTDPTAAAYRIIQKTLRCKPDAIGTALMCTTQPAAIGAVRACHDAGLTVGHDISVCAINCEPTGRYFVPSLTGLDAPEIMPLVDRCFDWFAGKGAAWVGPLLLVPPRANLYLGESTGAPAVVGLVRPG
jgi:hypothetical protein